MYLYFNKKGELTTKIPHGEPLRQGNNLNLYVCFPLDFKDEENMNSWSAFVQIIKSDGSTSGVEYYLKNEGVKVFNKLKDSEITYDLIDGESYHTFFASIAKVTNLPGNLDLSISLAKNDVVERVETATLFVEKTVGLNKPDITIDEDQFEILKEEYRKVNQRYDELNSSKVSIAETEENVIYGKEHGEEVTIPYSDADGKHFSVVTRNQDGKIGNISTPTKDDEATNKKYVDDSLESAIEKTQEYIDKKINDVVGKAPEEFDTLKELSDAYLKLPQKIGFKGVDGILTEDDILLLWEKIENGRYTINSKEYGSEIIIINKSTNDYSRITPSGKVIAYDFEENEWVQVSGGGGGGDSSIISITPITPLEVVSSIKTKTIIEFSWTSGSYGNGLLYTYVDNSLRGTPKAISQGTVSADISDYMTESTDYAVKFVIEDAYGNKRTIIYKVSIVELTVQSIFNDEDFYKSTIRYEYQVYGNVDKTMHFILDGVEKTEEVTSNGNTENYFITGLTHGVHTFQVYATATINGTDIKSNVYDYNIIYYEENNPRPLLSSKFKNVTITEGDNVVINYIAYTATSLQTSVVKHIINGNEKVYYDIPRGVQTWRVTDYNIGENTIKIQATNIIDESTSYTTELVFNVFVNKGEMNVEAEKNNLDLFLNSSIGKSNNDVDRNKWEYGNITTTFNDFNWNNNGWVLDNNNITALKLNGDARAIINYAPFANDIKTNGISIEIEFSTSNVLNYDEEIINIMANNIGISVKPTEFIFKSLQKEIVTQFKEDEHIRIGLVIQKAVENRFIFTYINGVLSNVFTYGSGDSFDQLTPAFITIGSNYCDINIYKIRVYTTALSPITMLNNYIADVELLSEKQKIYNRNKIYDANNNVLYNLVKGIMPVLTITCDNLPDAEDVVNTCSIQFENLFNSALNFNLSNVEIKVQGTSSLQYPYKNFDLKLQEALIQLYANAIKEKKVTLKVDYASSAGVYNAGNAKIVNDLYQVKNPAQQEDARVRNAIYGIPVAVFLKKSPTDTPKFHCKGSLNTSKLANALGYKEGDESWSTENNTSPLCLFDTNDFSTIGTDFDPRYLVEPTEPTEDYDKYANLKDLISWVYSCKGNVEKFKAEVEQHFNLYYLKMYYIYFMVMGGIDSMAKNMYLTYFAKEGKWYPQFYDMDSAFGIDNTGRLSFNYNIEPLDKVGNDYAYNGSLSVLWNLVKEAYDINKLLLQENEGNTTVVEDTDTISYMYRDLRSKGILTYESMMRVLYNDGIEMYPESIYNEDTEVKYIDWYLKGKDYLSSALGSTLDHLKLWIANRINYLDSKWLGEDYLTDRISCRITTPENVTPDYSLSLKSYRDMYMEIQYGSYYASTRADRNKTYVLEPELPSGTKFNDTETYIYGASSITEIGDLSKWYLSLFEGANAIKLSKLILGNPSSSYSNSNLKTLTLCTTESTPNYMMRYIDIRNCTGLEGSLDLSKLFALETIYAEGTNLKAIEFSNGGNLKLAHLPSTVNTLTLLNQSSLTDFQFEATNLVNLRIENSNVDTLDIIEKSIDKLNRVRLVGIDWQLNDAEILRVLLTKKGYTDSGANNEKSVLAGKVHINATIYSDEIEDFQRQWGTSLVVTANNVITRYACRFYNDDVLLDTQRVLPNQDVTYGGVLPTKEYTGDGYYAYKFIGWDKPLTNITKSTNFYAQFELVPYHQVVFQDYLGNVLSTKYVPDGTLATYDGETPTKPTDTDKKEKYVFSGWNPSIDLPITQNTIFIPQFTIIPLWTVTWQNWDNTLLYTELVENGKYATYVGETPTRPNDAQYGYTFAGWQPNNENTPITSDTTFTAGYSVEVLIKIQYLNWDRTVLQEFGVKKDESYSYTGPTPTRPDDASFKDYVFIRFEPSSYSETSRTYTAYFEGTLRTYNVYWYSEGNLIELDSNVPYGATAEYNGVTPTHSQGYVFIGWGTDDFTVTGDMYFYAMFDEPTSFKIKVNNTTVTPTVTVRGLVDNYDLTINWGDGTTDTYTLTSGTTTTCTKSTPYQNTGEYNVTMPPSEEFEFFGSNANHKLFYVGSDKNLKIIEADIRKTSINNAQHMFKNQDELIKVRIPNETNTLAYGLFWGASSLNDFIFPNPKETLIFSANCLSGIGLEKISIQDNWVISGMICESAKIKILDIGKWKPTRSTVTITNHFTNLIQLEQIIVSNENDYYEISDGVLYSKGNKVVELVAYKNKETITLGTPYTKIGDEVFAFDYQTTLEKPLLKKVIFENPISSFGSAIFNYNSIIEYVDLKETNITTISSSMFDDCKSMKEILYPPTITTLQNNSLRTYNNNTIHNFSSVTQVPTLTSAYSATGIFVIPDELYDQWISATNWVSATVTYVKSSEYVEE